jgi:hypothetical protein
MRCGLRLAPSSLLLGGALFLPLRATAQADPLELQASGEGEGGERIYVDPRRRPTVQNLKRVGPS